jgi:uncharacterized membrane protein
MSTDAFFLTVIALLVLLFPFLAIYAAVTASAAKRRVDELEQRIAALQRAPSAVAPTPGPIAPQKPQVDVTPTMRRETPVAAPAVRPAAPAAPPRPKEQRGDLERVIGGKWLNWIGIATLLIATALFLTYAFDNNWIGPAGRIALGFLGGAGLMIYSQFLFRKTYVYFSEGIAGLGAGVLYLSLWAAWSAYHLIPALGSLAGMIVVTAALMGFALARNSQRVALLALIGGFITPVLLNTGNALEVQLFTYLAVLNAALLWVTYTRDWRTLPLSFVWTAIYFWAWFEGSYEPSMLVTTLAFATLFFLEFAAVPVIRALRGVTLHSDQAALVLFNAIWYTVALHFMLFQSHRWILTAAIVALAIAHLAVARFASQPSQERPLARVLFAGLALTFITLAIPIRLQGQWVTIGWAVEGAVLVWTGFETRTQWLRVAGIVLFVLVVVRLMISPIEGGMLVFNQRFGTFVVIIAAMGISALLNRIHADAATPDERTVFRVVEVAINVLALWALSAEVLTSTLTGQRQALSLTLVWTLYAAALLIIGVRAKSALLRWQGLVLLGISIAKVFLYDLSTLALGLRILSFVALGIVLMGISFLYQKRLQPGRAGEEQ